MTTSIKNYLNESILDADKPTSLRAAKKGNKRMDISKL